MTIWVEKQILNVPAYTPICSEKTRFSPLHAHENTAASTLTLGVKTERVHAQNENQPCLMLLYTWHSSTAYV